MKPYLIETCCPDINAVRRALDAGTDRIELCEDLSTGGVTPSEELLRQALILASSRGVPVNVLVRPRGGGFVYSGSEIQQMIADIRLCKRLGVNAVVLGALREDGSVDTETMRRLIGEARPLSVTFHRAFDACADPESALEEIIALGCERLLTSGHEADAFTGRFRLADLVRRSRGRIIVMPGCGITPDNLPLLAAATLATEFHGSRLP